MNTKYLIFDFDGVLGDTWEAAVSSVSKTHNLSYEGAKDHILNYTKKPSHAKINNLTQQQIKQTQVRITDLNLLMKECKYNLFNGFIEEIKKIHDTKLAIVSSGSAEVLIKPTLKDINLNFTHILGIEDHHSKEDKILQISGDWGVPIKNTYYFTDTTTDVYELENILDTAKIIGCAWGWHGFDRLITVLPQEQILKNYSDIHKLF